VAGNVVIGMDPHKRSATIEVMAADEAVLGGDRFATDAAGYRAMLTYVKRWPERVWAIEGSNGIGHHIAARLVRDGEQVVDVPAKLSARARVFISGQGRKTDAWDAHSVALVGVRMRDLHPVVNDEQLGLLRVLIDRRRALGEDHTRMTSQLQQLLLELIPGGAKKDLSAAQAKVLLASVRPRNAVGKARRRVAAELIGDLERIYARSKAADKELKAVLATTGTSLTELEGIGPSGAARLLVEVGDIARFPSKAHFAPGTAPPPSTPPPVSRFATDSPSRQPTDQPRPAHHGYRPTTQPNHRPHLLRPPRHRRQNLHGSRPRPQTAPVRRDLPPHDPRRPTRQDEPGGQPGNDSNSSATDSLNRPGFDAHFPGWEGRWRDVEQV
jgi:transposase